MSQTTIVAHNGDFHSDDVFAVAALLLALGEDADVTILRTRDPEIIKIGTYVVDVGGEYDPVRERFDHHQKGGAGTRDNGIPYASFGLAWKKYGAQICGSEVVAQAIDERLVQPIDALDNGVEISKPLFSDVHPYRIENIVMAFVPTWKEKSDPDEIFEKVVRMVMPLLERQIKTLRDVEEGKHHVEAAYAAAADKRVIVMDSDSPCGAVLADHPEPLYAVYPSEGSGTWHAKAVRNDPFQFTNRKDFPEAWAGKKDAELAEVTGVADAVFCHNKRFIVVAKSREGILALVEKALRG